jgi:hypothetical protein
MTVHLSTLCRNLHAWTKTLPTRAHSVYPATKFKWKSLAWEWDFHYDNSLSKKCVNICTTLDRGRIHTKVTYNKNYAYNKYYSMLKEKLILKLLFRQDLINRPVYLLPAKYICVHWSSFPTRRPRKSIICHWYPPQTIFSFFWQDKENVITPAALCNVHTADWVESSGTERLEFAQMPTAGDEVEAGLRWEASASTVRAAIRTVLLYDKVK